MMGINRVLDFLFSYFRKKKAEVQDAAAVAYVANGLQS